MFDPTRVLTLADVAKKPTENKVTTRQTAPRQAGPKPLRTEGGVAVFEKPTLPVTRPVPAALTAPLVVKFDPTARPLPKEPTNKNEDMVLDHLGEEGINLLVDDAAAESVEDLTAKWLRKLALAYLAGLPLPTPPDAIQLAVEAMRKKQDKGWERSVERGNRAVLKGLPEDHQRIWAVLGPDGGVEFQSVRRDIAEKWLRKCRCEAVGTKFSLARRIGESYQLADDCNDRCEAGVGI